MGGRNRFERHFRFDVCCLRVIRRQQTTWATWPGRRERGLATRASSAANQAGFAECRSAIAEQKRGLSRLGSFIFVVQCGHVAGLCARCPDPSLSGSLGVDGARSAFLLRSASDGFQLLVSRGVVMMLGSSLGLRFGGLERGRPAEVKALAVGGAHAAQLLSDGLVGDVLCDGG